MIAKVFPLVAAIAAAVAAPGQSPAATSPSHKALYEVLNSGNPGQTLSAGFTTIDTESVKCSYSTCTVSMEIMQNVDKATCTDEWAIVGLVDGNSVDGGPYQNILPTSGKYQTRSWQGQYTMSQGTHTLAYQINLPCSANANQWSVNYLMTTP